MERRAIDSVPQAKPVQTRPCTVAATAASGQDDDIARLQNDLREGRAPARAAEQLGYRFIARARLSNDAGDYKVAEQAAACLESYQPEDPAALLLRGHILHQLHRFGEAEAIARRLVGTREFVLDFGLLGDALMEQGRLAEAADVYQKMIDLKPFYQSVRPRRASPVAQRRSGWSDPSDVVRGERRQPTRS